MPILPECAKCKRQGGYAEEGSKVCARCKAIKKETKTDEDKKAD